MNLTDGCWSGERCFVVGGGPSLRGFDWDRLAGERVIAVNRAYEVLPKAIICSMDLGFWKLHGEYVERGCYKEPADAPVGEGQWHPIEGRVALHVRVGDEKLPAHGPSRVVPCCADLSQPNPHLIACWGASLRTGLGCGGNSGFTAVNLADVLGARTIYLLGFDMRGGADGRQANWHDGYPGPQQRAGVYDKMRAAFNRVKPSIRANVVNLNPNSALSCFPRLNPKGVI